MRERSWAGRWAGCQPHVPSPVFLGFREFPLSCHPSCGDAFGLQAGLASPPLGEASRGQQSSLWLSVSAGYRAGRDNRPEAAARGLPEQVLPLDPCWDEVEVFILTAAQRDIFQVSECW